MHVSVLFLQFVRSSDGNLRREVSWSKQRDWSFSLFAFLVFICYSSHQQVVNASTNLPFSVLTELFSLFPPRGFRRRQQHRSDVPNHQWPATGQQRHTGFLSPSPSEVSGHSPLSNTNIHILDMRFPVQLIKKHSLFSRALDIYIIFVCVFCGFADIDPDVSSFSSSDFEIKARPFES